MHKDEEPSDIDRPDGPLDQSKSPNEHDRNLVYRTAQRGNLDAVTTLINEGAERNVPESSHMTTDYYTDRSMKSNSSSRSCYLDYGKHSSIKGGVA